MVERIVRNDKVVGSIPIGSTMLIQGVRRVFCRCGSLFKIRQGMFGENVSVKIHKKYLVMNFDDSDSNLLEILREGSFISKGLVCDMVESAHSGHLGTALGCSHVGAALFGKLLNFNPDDPRWINRDRFVLSCGHASAFLYVWLFLSGYDISLEDLRNFRQSHSRTPGHPEFGITPGVECTTGPLGQGVANAVGFAISGKKIKQIFDTVDNRAIDYRVVCLAGDGCMQEGIASEACSLAGHLGLDNLILVYDKNDVTLDGPLSDSQNDDVIKRFESYGFEISEVRGDDIAGFISAYQNLYFSQNGRPKLLILHSIIGDGIAEIAGNNRAHGESGVKFIAEMKKNLGLPEKKFFVSDRIKGFFRQQKEGRVKKYQIWKEKFGKFEHIFDEKLINFENISFEDGVDKISTRMANFQVMQELADADELLLTGSADLFSSNKNYLKKYSKFSATDRSGRNIQFGVREHAMGAITNGIAYDGYFHPSCATFLVFSDYMRSAIRVAALSKIHSLFLFTHDSIAVGQDGPTHQPVETVASLRCMPGLYVVRPADREELVGAWQLYYSVKNRPFAFILTRQDVKNLDEISANDRRLGVMRGGYIAKKEKKNLRCIVLSCGSELEIALHAANKFDDVRVVSMPCMERFDEQSEEWKEQVLPNFCRFRVVIEAGIALPWYKYAGLEGKYICVEDFGFSGPQGDLFRKNGLFMENLVKKIGD